MKRFWYDQLNGVMELWAFGLSFTLHTDWREWFPITSWCLKRDYFWIDLGPLLITRKKISTHYVRRIYGG
jgi:hypothetical protein